MLIDHSRFRYLYAINTAALLLCVLWIGLFGTNQFSTVTFLFDGMVFFFLIYYKWYFCEKNFHNLYQLSDYSFEESKKQKFAGIELSFNADLNKREDELMHLRKSQRTVGFLFLVIGLFTAGTVIRSTVLGTTSIAFNVILLFILLIQYWGMHLLVSYLALIILAFSINQNSPDYYPTILASLFFFLLNHTLLTHWYWSQIGSRTFAISLRGILKKVLPNFLMLITSFLLIDPLIHSKNNVLDYINNMTTAPLKQKMRDNAPKVEMLDAFGIDSLVKSKEVTKTVIENVPPVMIPPSALNMDQKLAEDIFNSQMMRSNLASEKSTLMSKKKFSQDDLKRLGEIENLDIKNIENLYQYQIQNLDQNLLNLNKGLANIDEKILNNQNQLESLSKQIELQELPINRPIDEQLKINQEKLNQTLGQFSEVMKQEDPNEAFKLLEDQFSNIPKDMAPELKDVMEAFSINNEDDQREFENKLEKLIETKAGEKVAQAEKLKEKLKTSGIEDFEKEQLNQLLGQKLAKFKKIENLQQEHKLLKEDQIKLQEILNNPANLQQELAKIEIARKKSKIELMEKKSKLLQEQKLLSQKKQKLENNYHQVVDKKVPSIKELAKKSLKHKKNKALLAKKRAELKEQKENEMTQSKQKRLELEKLNKTLHEYNLVKGYDKEILGDEIKFVVDDLVDKKQANAIKQKIDRNKKSYDLWSESHSRALSEMLDNIAPLLMTLCFFILFYFWNKLRKPKKIIPVEEIDPKLLKELQDELKEVNKRYSNFIDELQARYKFFHNAIQKIYYEEHYAPPALTIPKLYEPEDQMKKASYYMGRLFNQHHFEAKSEFSSKEIRNFRKCFQYFLKFYKIKT